MLKRMMDIVLAIAAIILLLPLLIVIAVAVLASSGTPVLFRQTRVGRGGRDFVLLKFRTMTPAPATDGLFHPGETSRVTPIGRWLRKSKLDELPQLWNVLLGQMSFVGPRPEVRQWVEAFPDRWRRVHALRPGLTDPASLVFCDEEALLSSAADPEELYRTQVLPRKLDMYEAYLNSRTAVGDLVLIARTPIVIATQFFRQRGGRTVNASR